MNSNNKIIGKTPFTNKQRLIVYWLIGVWTIFVLYLIVHNGICDCLYLTTATVAPFIAVFLLVLFWTVLKFRQQERKNFIYEDPKP